MRSESVFTDVLIFGFKNGVCCASSWKMSGRIGERENAAVVRDWMKRGYDIKMLHKDDPQAKIAHDQMWDNGKSAAARAAGQEPAP